MKIGNVIGGFLDFVGVPYQFGKNTIMAHLNTAYYHVHGQPFVYPDYADEIQLTANAAAWNQTGTIVEIAPANALSVSNFDIHWLNISNISEIATIKIDLFKGAAGSEVKIGGTKATRSTNQSRNGPNPIQIPQQEKNERISARVSSSTTNATTCLVSIEGHYYA